MSAHTTFVGVDRLPAFSRIADPVLAAAAAVARRKPPEEAFDLRQLKVSWEEKTGTLWTHIEYDGRPSYNTALLEDFVAWQDTIQATFRGRESEMKFLVLASRFPGVFSLGGDLSLFADRIRRHDREALVRYGRTCTRILYRNLYALDLPIVTVGLVEGDALGGGLESLLSFDVVVAERSAKFGLPETLFGLFPGMGAHCLLTRKLGAARADDMILSGRLFTAEEMHAMGLVHVLAEPGKGADAVREYIRHAGRRHAGHVAIHKASREVLPLQLAELDRIVEIWADASLRLREQDLKVMERLVAAQDRLRNAAAARA